MSDSNGTFDVKGKVVALPALVFRLLVLPFRFTIKPTKLETTIGGCLMDPYAS